MHTSKTARKAKRNRPPQPRRGSDQLYRNAKLIGGTAQIRALGRALRPITSAKKGTLTG